MAYSAPVNSGGDSQQHGILYYIAYAVLVVIVILGALVLGAISFGA